jgi:hypothetical protein
MFLSHVVFAWNVWRMTVGPSATPLAATSPVTMEAA